MLKNEEKEPGVIVLHNENNVKAVDSFAPETSNSNADIAENNCSIHNMPPKKFMEPTIRHGLMSIVRSSWLNVLLVFVPLGWASHFVWNSTTTFILNFVAIVPLAKLLGFATEDIALRTGEVIGGLLNATFGNSIELIISIIALTQNLVIVVQASMLGSILSNLLIVLGMSFFAGGLRYKEQIFNITSAQTSASLLFISVVSLLLPAAFYGSTVNAETAAKERSDILNISRATAIILLVIYFAYMVFQRQVSQIKLFNNNPNAIDEDQRVANETSVGLLQEKEAEESPSMPWWMAIVLLLIITALVAVCAEFLVSAIEQVVEQWHISETFVGLILLPIVGNAAEHITAITVAYKNKMDLALGVAVGSSIQVALLVTPIMVIVGWGINVDMSLYFNVYETAVLFAAVILVNYLIVDGKSNWLEGFMLSALYILIAISFYYYPDSAAGGLGGAT
ncbi:calcium/proton exchanger [Parasitella parasitica]|nr:calcium/proton exchanger [Parasitella parasitica]